MRFLLKLKFFSEKSFLKLFVLGISSLFFLACDNGGVLNQGYVDIKDVRRKYSITRDQGDSAKKVFRAIFVGCAPHSDSNEDAGFFLDFSSVCLDSFSVRLESSENIKLHELKGESESAVAMEERDGVFRRGIYYEHVIDGQDLGSSYTFKWKVEGEGETELETEIPTEFLSVPGTLDVTKDTNPDNENAFSIKIKASTIQDTGPYEEVWTAVYIFLSQVGGLTDFQKRTVLPIEFYKNYYHKGRDEDSSSSITFSAENDSQFTIHITKEELKERTEDRREIDLTEEVIVQIDFERGVKIKEGSVFFPAVLRDTYKFNSITTPKDDDT